MARIISLGPRVPRRGNWFSAWLGRFLLRLLGWRIVGDFPDVPRAVVIMAPHTSNWDGFIALSAVWALRLDLHFMGKHTLFRKPFGPLVRWLGGVPVDRDSTRGVVEQSVQRFRENSEFMLGISPEGTRKGAANWKTGFLRIAKHANVPVIVVGFDYARRDLVVSDSFEPGGDLDTDMVRVMENFRHAEPCRPDRLSVPLRQLRERPGPVEPEELRPGTSD